MTKEYIFTLEVEDEEVIWKCIVSDDKCVTYEGDEKCEEFTLTTQERKPHVLQLDTKAKVYDDVLPLQVENGMPFIKIEGNWVASDTTEEDRIQARILKYKKESYIIGGIGVAMLIYYLINVLFFGGAQEWPIAPVLGIFCLSAAAYTMVRVRNELDAMGRKFDWKFHWDEFKKK